MYRADKNMLNVNERAIQKNMVNQLEEKMMHNIQSEEHAQQYIDHLQIPHGH